MRVTRVGVRAVLLMAMGVLSVSPAWAHHSFAAYEPSKQIKLSGVVTEFKWTNPHVYIQLEAPDPASGETKKWLIECASTSILNRAGWKFNLIKAGDKITVIVAPLRNGEPAALLKLMTLADGSKYGNGAAAGTATIQ
jgi:uncharacterized protein DUF6152